MSTSPGAALEKIAWSQPPDLPGIEILAVENCRRLWRVFHQTYTVCTILKHGGATDWAYRGKRHLLFNRHLMLMEPGETHRNISHTAVGSFYVLQVSPYLVESCARESEARPHPHLKVAQTAIPALFQRFAAFHRSVVRQAPLLARQSLLASALDLLLREFSESGLKPVASPSPAGLRRAREFLHEHFADEVPLDQLARIAGLSRFHFLRTFSRHFGLSPHAYQIQLRVEKIRELLKRGVPVGEIEVGFSDQSHLTRHFKQGTGVTPGEYVRATGRRSVPLPCSTD